VTAADRDRFYAERDRRTRAYNVATERLDTPVRINVGADAASSPVGQALALTVINMVCRIHRRVELLLPDSDLLIVPLVPGRTLAEAGEALAAAIDPFIDLARSRESGPTLAVGDVAGTYWLAADGYIGHLCDAPTPITSHPASLLGAGMAACLGSAALLLAVTGARVRTRSVSLWGFGDQPVMTGPAEDLGPIDVGARVALIGAGAVGSAILYWLRLLGVRGAWTVVDGDIVKLHNTNRSMGLLAADAGWGNGVPGGPVANKAETGAALIGAKPVVGWYDEWVREPGPRPDLLIPAGGERNIRQNLGLLGLPFMIQGATSPDWQVQLHRHGPGDSCPACRFRSEPVPDMACSTGPLPVDSDPDDEDDSTDAALPFLSAAAGLLVVAALTQLEHGYLAQPVNQHGLLFGAGTQVDWWNTITRCRPGCTHRLSLGVRRQLNAGRRWSSLDDQP
jgi:molybdopterin/thiamine biosynthesis adenylyltransferase